jgi:hypothetical protein
MTVADGDGLWSCERLDDGYVFARTRRGVAERMALDAALIASSDARRLHEKAGELLETYGTAAAPPPTPAEVMAAAEATLAWHAMKEAERAAELAARRNSNAAPALIDDVARARHELELARPGLQTKGYSVQHFFELLGRFQVELYAGDGEVAKRVLEAGLPALEGALLSRTEWIAIARDWMKGRAELAAEASDGRAVLGLAKRIEQRRRPWGDALAMSLRAGLHARQGHDAEANSALEAVARLASTSELQLHSLAAEWLLAVRTGRSPEAAEARARSLGVRSLEKMSRVFVPGVSAR